MHLNSIRAMEIILAIATIIGGIAAIWYFVEKFRDSRASSPKTISDKANISSPKVKHINNRGSIHGAKQSGRTPFFITEPFTELDSAKKASKEKNRPLFLVIYNQEHPSLSKLYYSLGCFLDYFTTKKLVKDHFVTALVPVNSPGARELVPGDYPLENSLWVVLSPEGEILRREGVYANADEGLKRVRAVIRSTGA